MLSALGAVKKRPIRAIPNEIGQVNWPDPFFPNFFISINVLFEKKLNYIYINTPFLFYFV
jgi:hypothetical protein